VILDDGRVGEAHGEGVHSLVERALHEKQRVFAKEVGYGTGVAAFEEFPFVEENEAVDLGVCGEDGGFAEDVGGEDWTVAVDAVVDERLGVVGLVG